MTSVLADELERLFEKWNKGYVSLAERLEDEQKFLKKLREQDLKELDGEKV